MMGKAILFTCWAGLLGLSLYSAYRTGSLQNVGRDPVATVKKVNGQVFQRPENLSVYELILERDRVFNGDYISTGPGASAEVVLLSSKTLFIGENSLVQLTFGSDTDGIGSDIVTLLKGDVIARGEEAGKSKASQKKLRFNVGQNSVKNVEAGSGVQISKKVDESQATIKVVAGNAEVSEGEKAGREIKINEVVKVTSTEIPVQQETNGVLVKLAAMNVQRIDIQPENIASNDRLIKDVPRVIKNMNLASLKPIEDRVDGKVDPVGSNEREPEELPPPVKVKKKKRVKKIPVAVKSEEPYSVLTFTKSPKSFKGEGIYVVKSHRLLVKITGKPTPTDLLSVVKKYDGDYLFRGKAEALSGGVSVKLFYKTNVVYAVSKSGVQKIDATLVRSRPAAIELLKNGGYSIFTEKVNVLNVGH